MHHLRPRRSIRALAALVGLCLGVLGGCAASDPLRQPPPPPGVPVHPITGLRLAELVSEAEELGAAARQHAAISEAAGRGGARLLDPADPEFARARRVFADLVAIAHRSELPWQLHGLASPEPRSFGTGAGYVYLSSGLLGARGLVAESDDDALAAVLAHEIAHTALLHTRVRDAWQLSTLRARSNPYYGPEYTAAQEIEADRLATVYEALAGYDPAAAPRLWQGATQRFSANPGLWLEEHPLRSQRLRALGEAVALAMPFYGPGRQNPEWQAVLAHGAIFPAARPTAADASPGRPQGAGAAPVSAPAAPGRPSAAQAARSPAQALNAALDAQQGGAAAVPAAADSARALAPPSPLLGSLRLLKVQTGSEPGAGQSVQIYLHNGAERELIAVALRVIYFAGERPLAEDPDCGGLAHIPAGAAGWILCDFQKVPGATEYEVQLSGARFQ